MSRKILLTVTLALWSAGVLLTPDFARADTPLNRAVVQNLRNQVRLLLKSKPARPARKSDVMSPGDALSTARKSLAELRFNDNSLARIGEQALFRFAPNTRNFRLDNGTALLLIPPKQGTTRVRTPNAAAGIRGSALFVRYNPETNTTIVGALTNSQIEVSNCNNLQPQSASPVEADAFSCNSSQRQELKAGQMAVVVQNRIDRIYNFDLRTFYETSDLVQGLDLPLSNAPSTDPGIALVQQETAEALRNQAPLQGQGIVENPDFVTLRSSSNPQGLVGPDSQANPSSEVSPVLTNRPTQGDAAGRQPGDGSIGDDGQKGPSPQPSPQPSAPPPTGAAPPPTDRPDDPPPTSQNPPGSNSGQPENPPPGQGGTPPGQGDAPPPGQGIPPGQGTPPGQDPAPAPTPPTTTPPTTNNPPTSSPAPTPPTSSPAPTPPTNSPAPEPPKSPPVTDVPQVPTDPTQVPTNPNQVPTNPNQVPSFEQSNLPTNSVEVQVNTSIIDVNLQLQAPTNAAP